jgi:cation:H+ antiporter
MPIALLIVGLVVLVAGAEGLVRGAARSSLSWGISPLVVGLTIVALGTSAPEMAVSVGAAAAVPGCGRRGHVYGIQRSHRCRPARRP